MSSSIPNTQQRTDASAEVLLHLDDAGFRYGHRGGRINRRRTGLHRSGHRSSRWIFRNVNLQVRRGEVLAILGRNGVGKSTLLNSLIGLHSLTEGTVHLGGEPLDSLTATERARLIAYLPQMEGRGISYTVTEYLLMGRAPYIGLFSSPSRRDREQVNTVMEELGLLDLAHSPLNQLSGGQRQQVGIAEPWCKTPRSSFWTSRRAPSMWRIRRRFCGRFGSCAMPGTGSSSRPTTRITPSCWMRPSPCLAHTICPIPCQTQRLRYLQMRQLSCSRAAPPRCSRARFSHAPSIPT